MFDWSQMWASKSLIGTLIRGKIAGECYAAGQTSTTWQSFVGTSRSILIPCRDCNFEARILKEASDCVGKVTYF
jgi:hypothetical protein